MHLCAKVVGIINYPHRRLPYSPFNPSESGKYMVLFPAIDFAVHGRFKFNTYDVYIVSLAFRCAKEEQFILV